MLKVLLPTASLAISAFLQRSARILVACDKIATELKFAIVMHSPGDGLKTPPNEMHTQTGR